MGGAIGKAFGQAANPRADLPEGQISAAQAARDMLTDAKSGLVDPAALARLPEAHRVLVEDYAALLKAVEQGAPVGPAQMRDLVLKAWAAQPPGGEISLRVCATAILRGPVNRRLPILTPTARKSTGPRSHGHCGPPDRTRSGGSVQHSRLRWTALRPRSRSNRMSPCPRDNGDRHFSVSSDCPLL